MEEEQKNVIDEQAKQLVDQEKVEELKKVTQEVLSGIDRDAIETSVQNNNFEFEIDGETYKVDKPIFSQKQELAKFKLKKFSELMKNDDIMFEKDLIEKLKSKNIDIVAMNEKIKSIESKRKNLQYRLGEMIVKNSPESDLKDMREQIVELTDEQSVISVEKNMYLEFSLETQLLIYLYLCLTAMVTRKKVDEKWEKIWSSAEDLENCENEILIKKASFYTTIVSTEEYGV